MARFRFRFPLALIGSSGCLALLSAIGGPSCGEPAQTVCTPEVTSFCLCKDNTQGTHTCKADGSGFGACETEDGPCEEVEPKQGAGPTTTAQATANASSSSASTGSGLALYEVCEAGVECESGSCQNQFCTLECANFMECNKPDMYVADCVRLEAGVLQICAPVCSTQSDCEKYGDKSFCGAAKALDDPQLYIPVCANWGADLIAMPDGQTCLSEDVECHLGLSGREVICVFQTCTKGCREPADCPNGKSCSASGGNPGTCN